MKWIEGTLLVVALVVIVALVFVTHTWVQNLVSRFP